MRIFLIALGLIYAGLMHFYLIPRYSSAKQIAQDGRLVEARVLGWPSALQSGKKVWVEYEYEIAAQRFQGFFQTTSQAKQAKLSVYASRSHPELSTNQVPDRWYKELKHTIGIVTAGFLMLAGLLLLNGRRRL